MYTVEIGERVREKEIEPKSREKVKKIIQESSERKANGRKKYKATLLHIQL